MTKFSLIFTALLASLSVCTASPTTGELIKRGGMKPLNMKKNIVSCDGTIYTSPDFRKTIEQFNSLEPFKNNLDLEKRIRDYFIPVDTIPEDRYKCISGPFYFFPIFAVGSVHNGLDFAVVSTEPQAVVEVVRVTNNGASQIPCEIS